MADPGTITRTVTRSAASPWDLRIRWKWDVQHDDGDNTSHGRGGWSRTWLGAQWMARRVARQMRQEAKR